MRASVYDRYGPPEVLQLRDIPEPQARAQHVRIAVHAAALNPKDVLVRKGRMRWLVGRTLPRVPGYDVAGELIDPLGPWPSGTPVFGMVQSHLGGGCAEVASLRVDEVARAPKGLSMTEAAALPLAGLTALQALRDCLRIGTGDEVIINGASGGVGTLAVQIACAMGARVTAVSSTRNHDLVRELGATATLDYRSSDVTRERADFVFDVFGNLPHAALKRMARVRSCTTVPRPGTIAHGVAARVGLGRHSLVVVRSRRRDLERLASWVESKRLRPVVDRVVSLERAADGHAHIETRRAQGKVVVEIRKTT